MILQELKLVLNVKEVLQFIKEDVENVCLLAQFVMEKDRTYASIVIKDLFISLKLEISLQDAKNVHKIVILVHQLMFVLNVIVVLNLMEENAIKNVNILVQIV